MGSNIYTRKGDKGETSLVDGRRVPKDAIRVEAYGAVDETNSTIGWARSLVSDALLDRSLDFFQHRLFNCSSNLATPPDGDFAPMSVSEADIQALERAVDVFEQRTGPLSQFILPGGCQAAGALHIARTVCRRAERRIIALGRIETIDTNVRAFINRGSDFLFAAARYANAVENRKDVSWKSDHPIPEFEE